MFKHVAKQVETDQGKRDYPTTAKQAVAQIWTIGSSCQNTPLKQGLA